MPSDQEYLAAAGIDAETGGPANAAPDTASTPTPGAEAPTPSDLFEVGEYKIPGNAEWKLAHDGKIVKVPASTLANTYRQAQHLEGKYKSFNQERQAFEQQKAEAQAAMAFKQKYGALQEWSEKNPNDFQTIWDIYQNRDKHLLAAKAQPQGVQGAQVGQQGQQLSPFVDEISNLKKTVGELMQTKQSWDTYQQDQRMQKDTQQIWGEKETFQKSYPEINLEERDPDGVTLWAKIMRHGVEQRIPNFKTAAMDFLESRLQDTWAARSRNEVVKGFKQDRQQGIMQRSATPITGQGQSKPVDTKKMSYAELSELAKGGGFASA